MISLVISNDNYFTCLEENSITMGKQYNNTIDVLYTLREEALYTANIL